MKNWTHRYLTAEDRSCIVKIDILKNGETTMPEDKIEQLYQAAEAVDEQVSVLQDQKKELETQLGETFDQLNNEKNKRVVDVQALQAAEKRVKALEEKLYPTTMRHTFDPLREYSIPSWASYFKFPTVMDIKFPTVMGIDFGAGPGVAPKALESDMWTSGDGSRIEVKKMTDAHLHYALAKVYRGEYPDAQCRTLGFNALKREAARRLQSVFPRGCTITAEELKHDLAWERERREEQGRTNAKMSRELDDTKNTLARVWKDPNQEAMIAALQAEFARLHKRHDADVEETKQIVGRSSDRILAEREETKKLRSQLERTEHECTLLRANLEATQKLVHAQPPSSEVVTRIAWERLHRDCVDKQIIIDTLRQRLTAIRSAAS